ncbi:FAD-linked sulfhydryl oxidase ALR [Stomoxys calcitrans]|uniref:FAD-linked sulfhydryl oxidase ALR n=1 Tax=Stomoxys calcitrans TaxID=35570 RepID=UPI0027E293E1|nr:FAD-linked sulfhydryl oxidase ALR [Stomoxys calcitrans]
MTSYDSYGTPTKPDTNCRTCTDFKFWSKQQRQMFQKTTDNKDAAKSGAGDSNDNSLPREDCPLDKSKLGQSTWGLLHTMAAVYSDNPTDNQKSDIKTFFDVFSRLYPCEYCAKDFRKDLRENPVKVDSQHEFSQWLCQFHNRVNAKLGKAQFDCSKVNERWRDGWLDGSCD